MLPPMPVATTGAGASRIASTAGRGVVGRDLGDPGVSASSVLKKSLSPDANLKLRCSFNNHLATRESLVQKTNAVPRKPGLVPEIRAGVEEHIDNMQNPKSQAHRCW